MDDTRYQLGSKLSEACLEEYLNSLEEGVETSRKWLLHLIEHSPRWNWDQELPEIMKAVEALKNAHDVRYGIGCRHLWSEVEKD
tara:strand:- start:103 stop:354 length:252 start_codon:yes stop_codon:yes gene_type:complete